MGKNLVTEAERYLSFRHKDKRRSQVLRIAGLLVVFATVYALILPAVTMSNEVECGKVEHIHTESCWQEQLVSPQPRLVCAAESSEALVLHTHDGYCYNDQGELICALEEREAHAHGPECYQEQRTLLCGQIADPGHHHDASCYTYVRVESADAVEMSGYTCGFQEGEGAHHHTEECYPEERAAEPLCGLEETGDEYDEQGNLVRQGHIHTDKCWLVRVHEKLVCGQEESEDVVDETTGEVLVPGHHHTAGCRLTGDELCCQYGCGQHESVGHVHTAACGQGGVQADSQGELWEQVLTCGEEEREPGHIHTDACYEIHQVLTCHKQELQPHTHDAGCYDESGALTCGRPEAVAHQHAAECFVMPEGGQELVRTLICGMEEHVHTEQCYVKPAPKDDQVYYCGLQEHIHTMPDCYFESGELRCTLTEHVHDLTCLQPPAEVSEEPVESQEPAESAAPDQTPVEGVELVNAEFPNVYFTDGFTMSFYVNGFAQVAEAEEQTQSQPQPTQDPQPSPSGEILIDITNQMVPLAAMPRMMAYGAPLSSEADGAAPSIMDQIGSMTAPGSDTEPEGTAVDDSSQSDLNGPVWPENWIGDGWQAAGGEQASENPSAPVEPAPETESPAVEPTPAQPERVLLDPGQVRFVVEPLEDGGDEWETALAAAAELGEEEQAMVLQMFTVAAYAGDGRKLDMSGWDMEAEVVFSDELLDYAESAGEEQLSTIGTDGESGEESAQDMGTVISVLDLETSEEMAYASVSSVRAGARSLRFAVKASRGGDSKMGLMLIKNVYPHFDVQYYAYIKQPEAGSADKQTESLAFIDTSGKQRPSNGTSPKIEWIKVNTVEGENKGAIVYDTRDLQQIYLDSKLQFNPLKEDLTIDGLLSFTEQENEALGTMSDHYDLKELWVLKAGADPKSIDPGDWDVYGEGRLSQLEFTNNPAAAGGNVILIQETAAGQTMLRLVYDQKVHKENATHDVTFYDYDITKGVIKEGEDKGKVDAWRQGINSEDNVKGIATTDEEKSRVLGFGNGPGVVDTGLGDNKGSDGRYINQATTAAKGDLVEYNGCSFGLVSGMKGDHDVEFGNGVKGPSLFGTTAEGVKGKTVINGYSLEFKGEGDTYTMTTVKDASKTVVLENLDKLGYIRDAWHKEGTPATRKLFSNEFWPLDNETGTDPKFGSARIPALKSGGLPESDHGGDHNAYFGMHFTVQFTLPRNYTGPLEYYFYGDDDMWVFLGDKNSDKLVCDIGGVHGSVGEYVNLWDYLGGDDVRYTDRKGDQTYTLSFFYTERGASGSTCWMQYTLPNAVTVPTIPEPGKGPSLTIEKEVAGNMATEENMDSFYTFDLNLTKVGGQVGAKLYNAKSKLVKVKEPVKMEDGRYYFEATNELDESGDASDYTNIYFNGGGVRFQLKNGWKLVLQDLPAGTGYTVTEVSPDGCQVSVSKDGAEAAIGDTASDSVKADGSEVKFINSFGYELPETGGAGVAYTMACVPLLAVGCLWYKKKSQGEGAADDV